MFPPVVGAYSISSPVDTGVYCVHSPLLEGASYITSPVITGAYSGYSEEFISPADAGVCFGDQPSSPAVAGAICDLNLNSVDDSFSGQLFEHLMSDECEFMLLHDQSNAMQNVSSNIANYICPWFINSAGCEDFTYPDIQGVCVEKKCNLYPSSVNLNMVDIHHSVFTSRKPNFACCKIIIETKFNFDL